MAETSGSCAIVSHGRRPGIGTPNRTILSDLKKNYEMQKAAKMVSEYERIMKIPPSERTFSEKMLVAQVQAERTADFIDKVMTPSIKYIA